MTRKGLVAIWLVILFATVLGLFWKNELVYNLPTPVPADYKFVALGENLHLDLHRAPSSRPLLLHFFNPACPCSKFNIRHFKKLAKQYGGKADFIIVAITANRDYTESSIQKMFRLNLPVLFDTSIAKKCGVYSTPQAVIVDAQSKLFYRGNYNRSRYCSNNKTEYARMALDSLLQYGTRPAFDVLALKAYGCQLPKCNKL